MSSEFETVREQTILEVHRFSVVDGTYRFRGDGEEVQRQWVHTPASVAIAAYDDDQVHLVRQPRQAVGRSDVLEVPAGVMDAEGESPLETAKRELAEEIGIEASAWVHATSCFTTIGVADEVLHVFLATGLREVERPQIEEDERIDVVRRPLADLDELIDTNADAKTLIALLWLRRAMLRGTGPAST